jgi:peptidyl-prolyl cis-trans isomerase D
LLGLSAAIPANGGDFRSYPPARQRQSNFQQRLEKLSFAVWGIAYFPLFLPSLFLNVYINMSIIQNIRDKYARWAVVAIAISLLGFILMDAMSNRTGGLFSGGRGKTLGNVNGQKIDAEVFAKKVEAQEQRMNAQGNGNVDELTRQRLTEQLWNQEVEVAVMNTEFKKLGMTIGKKELNDIILNNPTEDLRRNGTNEQGVYDGVTVQQSIKEQLKKGTPEQKKSINEFIDGLEYSRMSEKYNGMLTGSIYYPKWFIEKENNDRSAMAKISYVAVPYSTVADSAVRITDKEIQDYIDKNKDLYKQKEGRSISYVSFAATPTSGDSAVIRNEVLNKKAEFAADTNAAQYLARNGTQIKFVDNYFGKSQMQMPMKDSIQRLGKNQAFGPYLDFGQTASNYVIAKMLDMKTLPDSMKARHILVQTADPQQGRILLEDSIGKKRIDSIVAAINNGARFDSLAVKLSDDKGSAEKGGLLVTEQGDYFAQGKMVKAFNDFCSEGNIGEKKVVKTEFGYHYIEILDKKNPQPYYKVAYLAKQIVASDDTESNAENNANSFAGNSRTLDAFTANVEKDLKPKGLNSLVVNDISPLAYNIPQLGGNVNCRQFVKAVYEADKGKVLQPMRVGDNFIVAVVTAVNKEGIMSAATTRMQVEPLLRNKKKAEEIKKKIGAVTTPEALASSMSLQVQTADSVRFDTGAPGGLGSEQKVIGAAFNPSNKGKVIMQALDGLQGVYVVRVDDVTATSAAAGTVEEQQKMMIMQTRMRAIQALNPQMQMYGGGGPTPADILKQAAKIKDNRADFY